MFLHFDNLIQHTVLPAVHLQYICKSVIKRFIAEFANILPGEEVVNYVACLLCLKCETMAALLCGALISPDPTPRL